MERLPDYGPLQIDDLYAFLEKGKVEFEERWNSTIKQSGCLSDFTLVQFLGQGSFGKVLLGKHKKTAVLHAMKVMEKFQIFKYSQILHTKCEKNVLYSVNFPFLIHLDFYFIDNTSIYFIMPFVTGGEMFKHLQALGKFEEQLARFYGAQVVLGLEYLHFLDIIYRDLKPENILVDHTGYLKIADFGFAKIVKTRTYTLCGTPEYIAPEIIANRGYGKAADWWSLGVLLYEMASGRAPFFHRDAMKMYEMAAALKYFMPKTFSPELKDLVKNILQTDLSKRYGNLKNGVKDIKEHKWFRPMVWPNLLNRQLYPLYIPKKYSISGNGAHGIDLTTSDVNLYEKEFEDF